MFKLLKNFTADDFKKLSRHDINTLARQCWNVAPSLRTGKSPYARSRTRKEQIEMIMRGIRVSDEIAGIRIDLPAPRRVDRAHVVTAHQALGPLPLELKRRIVRQAFGKPYMNRLGLGVGDIVVRQYATGPVFSRVEGFTKIMGKIKLRELRREQVGTPTPMPRTPGGLQLYKIKYIPNESNVSSYVAYHALHTLDGTSTLKKWNGKPQEKITMM